MRPYWQAESSTRAAIDSLVADRRRGLACALVVALGALLAGPLAASFAAVSKKAAASPSVLTACYSKRNGALRIISARGSCGSGGVKISWSVAGIAGAPGAGGEAGSLLGPQGVAGESGPPGTPGLQGPPGAAAAQGAAGVTGATGPTGMTGPTGAEGPAGKGGVGPTGENGKNGVTGGIGPTGPTGENGAAGATGATGAAGSFSGEALPKGSTETGTWVVTTPSFPEAGREASGAISFPIPLAKAPKAVHYLTAEQTRQGTPECPKTSTATEVPKATEGVLCVYTGQETLINAKFKSIQNTSGTENAASLSGAFVIFEANTTEAANSIVVQGTWAVMAE
jgi:hypothetical protein